MKDQDGWKVLKAEVPAGLHLLPGLRADVPVQLLAREVLQEPGNNMGCSFGVFFWVFVLLTPPMFSIAKKTAYQGLS